MSRSRAISRIFGRPALILALVAVIVAIPVAVVGTGSRSEIVQRVITSLAKGDLDDVASSFWYFERIVGPGQASKDRRGVTLSLFLLREHFGRLDRLEAVTSTAKVFASMYIESGTTDLWRASPCLTKTLAFRTRFVDGPMLREADIILDLCVDATQNVIALKRLTVHFVRPDQETPPLELPNKSRATLNVLEQMVPKLCDVVDRSQ